MHRTLLFASLLILICQFTIADEKPIEQFSATISAIGSAKGPTPITIKIYTYTPPSDVAMLRDLLKSKGDDAVADEVWKHKVGYIAPVGGLGMDINYARTFETDQGRTIRMATARAMPFWEMRSGRPSTDYPFSMVELIIGKDGKISGTLTAAAKVDINQDNVLEIKKYGSDRLRLINIKKEQ